MNLYKQKKRRRFLIGFIISMLLIGMPIVYIGASTGKYETIGYILGILIPVTIGILVSKTAKK